MDNFLISLFILGSIISLVTWYVRKSNGSNSSNEPHPFIISPPDSTIYSPQVGSPEFTSRQRNDLREMQEAAPNAKPRDVDGTIIWYEPTYQGGRQYELAYWHDGSDYQAAVMKGDKPEDRGQPGKSHLFDDRRICLKGADDPPYSKVVQARARAVLWALGYSDYLKTGRFPFDTVS